MADGSPSPKKVHPDNPDLESLSKADLIVRLKEQEQYIKQLESKKPKLDKGDDDVDWTERLKQHQRDAARRENTLVHRLTTKEQELQDMLTQIAEIKQAEGTTQLKSMLLDPAVNIVFQKMTKEMDDAQEKLKQTQNELSAWKFTPDRCISPFPATVTFVT
ncbi:pre-mRNA-splicing regulator WTAP-like [Mya arenaria]|uniref:pre-mRNA-splicing regulator WTAP-like n=1 Tax=Mya arenaria TaxID=6604 RepID=UPI0022E49654|nr:pre-mRNA-splicing regulator WTAP-like [Mya arenaria]